MGMNVTKVHCKHVWECHHETSCITNILKMSIFKKKVKNDPWSLLGPGP
jgi:hypothetical protein